MGYPNQSNFRHNQQGATTIIVVLCVTLFVMMIGLGVDTGRAYLVKNKVQLAMDAALLGGVSTLTVEQINSSNEGRVAAVQAEVENLFAANYPANYMGSTIDDGLTVTESARNVYEISVTATMPYVIMSIFGHPGANMTIVNQVTRQDPPTIELALVLDVTGSMTEERGGPGTKLDGLKTAVAALANGIYSARLGDSDIYTHVIPYNMGVNVGASRIARFAKAESFNPDTLEGWNIEWFGTRLSSRGEGLLIQNTPFYDLDTAPNTEDSRFTPIYSASTEVVRQSCAPVNPRPTSPPLPPEDLEMANQHWSDQIEACVANLYATSSHIISPGSGLPVTPDPIVFGLRSAGEVINEVNELSANGSTRINIGLAWGWYTLSPNWRGLWDGSSLPNEYDSDTDRKIMVLMTDGQNNLFPSVGAQADNDAVETICENIKAKGIDIYTVALGTEAAPGTTAANLLDGCATENSMSFYAQGNPELERVFAHIADDIISRLVHLTK